MSYHHYSNSERTPSPQIRMATLITSMMDDYSYAESQRRVAPGSTESENDDRIRRRIKCQMIVDQIASEITSSLQIGSVEMESGDTETNHPKSRSCSSSVGSAQSKDCSEYSLSVCSIKHFAVASVTGAPEKYLRATKGNGSGQHESTSVNCESSVECLQLRETLNERRREAAFQSNLQMSEDLVTGVRENLIVFGGDGSQSSFESSLGGSQMFMHADFEDDAEDGTVVSSNMADEINRVKALLQIHKESEHAPLIDHYGDTLKQLCAIPNVCTSDSSFVSVLSMGSADTTKTNGTNRSSGTFGSSGDYSMELQLYKQSAVSSVTGNIDTNLREPSCDVDATSSFNQSSFADSYDLKSGLEDTDLAFGSMQAEIERVQALLDLREADQSQSSLQYNPFGPEKKVLQKRPCSRNYKRSSLVTPSTSDLTQETDSFISVLDITKSVLRALPQSLREEFSDDDWNQILVDAISRCSDSSTAPESGREE